MRLYLSRFFHSTRTSLPKTISERFSFDRCPNGCAFFGSIDAPQPDLVPLALAIEHRHGVAVGHANDTPLEDGRNSAPTGEDQQQRNRKVLQETPSSGLMHSGPSTEPRLIAGLTG